MWNAFIFQVALVDVLRALGLEPDGMVGHSVGELGCAYADGCFTAEQMILAAFWRGKAVEESNLEQGAMAALGMYLTPISDKNIFFWFSIALSKNLEFLS